MSAPKLWPAEVTYKNAIGDIKHTRLTFYTLPVLAQGVELFEVPEDHPAHGRHASLGVRTARALPANTTIGIYAGLNIPHELWPRDSAYLMGPSSTDAALYGNELRFINDYHGVASAPNVGYGHKTPVVHAPLSVRGTPIRTLREIQAGEELLLDYGDEYCWDEEDKEQNVATVFEPGQLVNVDMSACSISAAQNAYKNTIQTACVLSVDAARAEYSVRLLDLGRDVLQGVPLRALHPPRVALSLKNDQFNAGDRVEVERDDGYYPAIVLARVGDDSYSVILLNDFMHTAPEPVVEHAAGVRAFTERRAPSKAPKRKRETTSEKPRKKKTLDQKQPKYYLLAYEALKKLGKPCTSQELVNELAKHNYQFTEAQVYDYLRTWIYRCKSKNQTPYVVCKDRVYTLNPDVEPIESEFIH